MRKTKKKKKKAICRGKGDIKKKFENIFKVFKMHSELPKCFRRHHIVSHLKGAKSEKELTRGFMSFKFLELLKSLDISQKKKKCNLTLT